MDGEKRGGMAGGWFPAGGPACDGSPADSEAQTFGLESVKLKGKAKGKVKVKGKLKLKLKISRENKTDAFEVVNLVNI